ncbi:MAG TPA: hypothetical protein VLL51_09865 [Gemmatimonadales bacterium]|nr:hypothetical protein [Gemmatimonadales bacterium]
MGSIPTRSRHRALAVGLVLLALVPGRVGAQDTTVVSPSVVVIQSSPQATDTVSYPKPPVSPMGAFLRSLALPGWSQSLLNRRLTAGLFIAAEGLAIGMAVKTSIELDYLRRTSSNESLVEDKRQQQEDWITLIVFNHLFAGLEGYVGAHLWDFPEDIRFRAVPLPGGGIGAGVQVPIRLR